MRSRVQAAREGVLVALCLTLGFACTEAAGRPTGGQLVFAPDAGTDADGAAPCEPDPAKWDVPGNDCDDDGDGTADNPPTCDQGLAPGGSAEGFARAIGICTKADAAGYGLVSAAYTRGYDVGDPPAEPQHAILSKFGNVLRPREGVALGVLSTGYAQEFDQPAEGAPDGGPGARTPFAPGVDWKITGSAPPGLPPPTPGCSTGGGAANDLVNVHLVLRAPKNALGFKFDFDFHSAEWPGHVCSSFNDFFVAFYRAPSFDGGVGRNISFDTNGRAVSVNIGFFDRCTAGILTGCTSTGPMTLSSCAGGQGELQGTGFGLIRSICPKTAGESPAPSSAGGATGWLTSRAPVTPGETLTLDFMIWDTADGALDSLVLIDNFQWIGEPIPTEETIRPAN